VLFAEVSRREKKEFTEDDKVEEEGEKDSLYL
jgi:hypothetical protein